MEDFAFMKGKTSIYRQVATRRHGDKQLRVSNAFLPTSSLHPEEFHVNGLLYIFALSRSRAINNLCSVIYIDET